MSITYRFGTFNDPAPLAQDFRAVVFPQTPVGRKWKPGDIYHSSGGSSSPSQEDEGFPIIYTGRKFLGYWGTYFIATAEVDSSESAAIVSGADIELTGARYIPDGFYSVEETSVSSNHCSCKIDLPDYPAGDGYFDFGSHSVYEKAWGVGNLYREMIPYEINVEGVDGVEGVDYMVRCVFYGSNGSTLGTGESVVSPATGLDLGDEEGRHSVMYGSSGLVDSSTQQIKFDLLVGGSVVDSVSIVYRGKRNLTIAGTDYVSRTPQEEYEAAVVGVCQPLRETLYGPNSIQPIVDIPSEASAYTRFSKVRQGTISLES
ncbi:MAG: hypothetical protein QM680_10685 [Luteolibacter sp.]